MQHLQLLLYVLLLSTGFGGITVTSILWHRLRDRLLLVMLVIIILFSVGLLFFVLLFYVREIVIYPVDLSQIAAYANLVITAFMYAGLGVCVQWVAPDRSAIPLLLFATPVVGVYVTFGILPPQTPALASWVHSHAPFVSVISVLAPSLFLGFSGWRIRTGSISIETPSVRFFLRWLGVMLVAFAVTSSTATLIMVPLGLGLVPSVALNYLLFLSWNAVAIAAFIKYLTHPADLLESGKVPEESQRRYNISKRETDVIEQISRGLTNKEVADKLNISFTTVRTHVYNIFKKTGAASRVELLRILSGK